jgi:hypothetical protein
MTPAGTDTPCPCFTLDDAEDVVEEISAAAASLTIIPSASDASWGKVVGGGDGRRTPSSASRASARLAARDARSVTSALTDAPSLASFSPFAGDFMGGGGGGFGWGGRRGGQKGLDTF